MTKQGIAGAAIVALLVATTGNVVAFDLTEWKYCSEVAIEDGDAKYCQLVLTGAVYNVARPDLADIRLTNSRGQEIPYVIVRPGDVTERRKYSPSIINRTTDANSAALVTLDFGQKMVKNSIEVMTRGDSFRRAVRIEGSDDNVEFFTIVATAYVFAVSGDRRFEQVDLPANDYRYLRIRVWPMPSEAESPVIENVGAFEVEERSAERQPVEMKLTDQSEDTKNKSSIYTYDMGNRRLPVSEIRLDIADDTFYRCVTVEGRDAATRTVEVPSEDNRQRFMEINVPWERIISDTIYRYTSADDRKHERLLLRVPSGRAVHRHLKITVNNYDDKPLTVTSASAKMTAHSMVFENKDSSTAVLYIGSESAGKPHYDLEHTLSSPLEVKAKAAKLSDVIYNPLFAQAGPRPVAWTEKHRILLLIVLAAAALVLGGFILKSFKTIRVEEPHN